MGVKVRESHRAWRSKRKARRVGVATRSATWSGAELRAWSRRTHSPGRNCVPFSVARDDLSPTLAPLGSVRVRVGEVCGLQWQDVDLDAGLIKERPIWSRQRLGPPKTRQDRADATDD